MRNRTVLSASLTAFVLAFAPSAWSQQEGQQAQGRPGENANLGQRHENANRDRDKSSPEGDTIRGIVAGIAAEGETAYDYKTNRGMALEAAFLTVVGSPVKTWGEMPSDRPNAANGAENSTANQNQNQNQNQNHRMRHNVYMVWLSPRTKVCEASAGYGRSSATHDAADANRNAADGDKTANRDKNMKEVTLDQLEVGDRVEIKFNKREDSAGNTLAHQSDQMRQKYGRHRTYVVDATSITILPSDGRDNDRSATREKSEK
jgi:hypothetical protein